MKGRGWFGESERHKNAQEKRKQDPFRVYFKRVVNQLSSPSQKLYYNQILKRMKPRKMGRLTPAELQVIDGILARSGCKPKKKACFQIAQSLASDSKGKIEYVEGFYMSKILPLPLDHAWNSINGKDFDIIHMHCKGEKSLYFGCVFSHREIMHNQIMSRRYCSVFSQQIRDLARNKRQDQKTI